MVIDGLTLRSSIDGRQYIDDHRCLGVRRTHVVALGRLARAGASVSTTLPLRRHRGPGSGREEGATPVEQEGARRSSSEHRLDRYVGVSVAVAAAVVALAVLIGSGPVPSWPIVGALAAGLAVLGAIHVDVPLRGAQEGTTLSEVALVPIMALLSPGPAVLVALVGGIVAEAVLTRGQVRKLVFNVAWLVVGVALGSWVHDLLAAPGFEPDAIGLLAALAAGATYVAVNLAAFAGVMTIAGRRRYLAVLRDEMPSSVVINLGTALYGVLATALIALAPLALAFLVLPILVQRGPMHARSEGHAQLAAERDRFERTVEGTSDGVVLLDRDGRIEVFNPAMERLTDIDADRALGVSLPELGLADLDPGARPATEASSGSPSATAPWRSVGRSSRSAGARVGASSRSATSPARPSSRGSARTSSRASPTSSARR
jgi:PAS domain-containing protein